jgi:hypothetical protein
MCICSRLWRYNSTAITACLLFEDVCARDKRSQWRQSRGTEQDSRTANHLARLRIWQLFPLCEANLMHYCKTAHWYINSHSKYKFIRLHICENIHPSVWLLLRPSVCIQCVRRLCIDTSRSYSSSHFLLETSRWRTWSDFQRLRSYGQKFNDLNNTTQRLQMQLFRAWRDTTFQ